MDWVKLPTLTFSGSEKLHGENMAVCYTDGELWIQGRNQVRTLLGDQNGMAQFVEERKEAIMSIINSIKDTHKIDTLKNTIVLDCEWAGGNIQRGNAACSGTDKAMYLFDFARIISNEDDSIVQYISTQNISDVPNRIYNLRSFAPTYSLTLDFNNPEQCEQQLKDLATTIEDNSPIAAYFDKPANVGEGAVLTCMLDDTLLRLKTKGEKHGGKPKTPKEGKRIISDEEKAFLTALADKLTPVWRINQGITESGTTEVKHVGQVLKWVMADIVKEEIPTLEEAGVEFKKVQGFVASAVKDYYFDNLKDTKA
jgi:hypothetical protein